MSGRWSGNWKLAALVFERSPAKGATRHILLEISHRADSADGYTTVSLDDLVSATGHSRRTVLRSIADAKRRGELAFERGTGTRQNRYRIRADLLETLDAQPPSSSGRNAPQGRPASSGRNAPPRSGRNAPLERGHSREREPLAGAGMHAGNGRNAPLAVPSRSPRARIQRTRSRGSEGASADAESHRAVAPLDVDIDRMARDLFRMPNAGDGAPADEVPTARGDEQRVALVDQAAFELREVERVAGDPRTVRATLASLGWNEATDGKVSEWLRRLTNEQLLNVAFRARADQRRVEAAVSSARGAARPTGNEPRPLGRSYLPPTTRSVP
jgi:hypothetical protein